MDRVHIALVANDRYRPGLLCARHGMEASCADPGRLVFHEFGDRDLEPFLPRVAMRDFNGSKLPYLRLFLPELLPECDWVIYSDVDTLWSRDPCELWNERDDAVSVCWVKDLDVGRMAFERWAKGKAPAAGYACSGVALINLKKWRETDFTRRAVEFLRTYGCPPYPDQDLMNVLLAGDAKMLDQGWDTMIPSFPPRPCVLHITGVGRALGKDRYDGTTPQYIYWFDYYRRNVLGLGPQERPLGLRLRLGLLAALSASCGWLLDFLDRFPGPYGCKRQLMRLRRQLAWSRLLQCGADA